MTSQHANEAFTGEAAALDQAVHHNAAYDSALTRGPAQVFERIAEPLATHIYGPIANWNHTAGVAAVNTTLTGPRLLEPLVGERYIRSLETGHRWRALGWLGIKCLLKMSDGVDGPVARSAGTTSLLGAGFDPLVDMIGTHDDGVRIKQAHRYLGIDDQLTESVINARLALDAAVIVVGGGANTLMAKRAESMGADVPARDQPKANAPAKLKFGLSALADAVMLLGTIPKDTKTRESFKKAGRAILIGSIAAGLVSIVKYTQSAKRNADRAREAKLDQSESEHDSDSPATNATRRGLAQLSPARRNTL